MTRRLVAPWLMLLLAACGSSSSSTDDGNPFGFDFDRFDYNGVVPVPLSAFREDRKTNGDDDAGVAAALFERVRADATNMTDIPFQGNWDMMLDLVSNGQPDDRIPMRFFLAYEVEHNPTAGTCTVRIHVIEGLPYDASRPALATYTGMATLGAMDREGQVITTPIECSEEATHVAFDALLLGAHFAEGWSRGPPAHLGSP